jgi:very-short-patch-repair endonuclease
MMQQPPRNGEGDRRPKAGGGGGPNPLQQPFKQVRKARTLRKDMSLPEVLLWRELRTRPGGYKFRKQVPMAPYTIDFSCLSGRLAIEIDSEVHQRGVAPTRDALRDAELARRGFRTLRIPAREVLRNLEDCVNGVVAACREAGPPPPSARADGPPPRSGEVPE